MWSERGAGRLLRLQLQRLRVNMADPDVKVEGEEQRAASVTRLRTQVIEGELPHMVDKGGVQRRP